MVYKILGVLIIAAAGALAFLTLKEDLDLSPKKTTTGTAPCASQTPAQQLAQLINDDFRSLAQAQQLPVEWNSIATVEVRMNSSLASAILGKVRPQIQRVKEGANYLELQFMDLPDEENPGIIVQASLFDIKSKNKIFEIGRTYTMNDLNKVNEETASQQNTNESATQKANKSTETSTTPAESSDTQ